jgi:hypothetical protein
LSSDLNNLPVLETHDAHVVPAKSEFPKDVKAVTFPIAYDA